MKKTFALLSVFMLSATFLLAQQPPPKISVEVIIGTRPPAPNEAQLMRMEEEKHPNVTRAMHDVEMAIKSLNDAPSDFGGHKGQALTDLKQGLISMRKALYFRLYQDTH